MRFWLAVAAVAAETTLGAADTSLFSDSFEGIAEGAELCDTGAVGGTWGETPVPEATSNVWYDVRIETRTIAGTRYAGFSVLGGGVDRTFTLNLPRRRVGTKDDSCLALVAYQSDGKTVVARNYRLVRRKESGFAVIVK